MSPCPRASCCQPPRLPTVTWRCCPVVKGRVRTVIDASHDASHPLSHVLYPTTYYLPCPSVRKKFPSSLLQMKMIIFYLHHLPSFHSPSARTSTRRANKRWQKSHQSKIHREYYMQPVIALELYNRLVFVFRISPILFSEYMLAVSHIYWLLLLDLPAVFLQRVIRSPCMTSESAGGSGAVLILSETEAGLWVS